jgi:hypothetical protein
MVAVNFERYTVAKQSNSTSTARTSSGERRRSPYGTRTDTARERTLHVNERGLVGHGEGLVGGGHHHLQRLRHHSLEMVLLTLRRRAEGDRGVLRPLPLERQRAMEVLREQSGQLREHVTHRTQPGQLRERFGTAHSPRLIPRRGERRRLGQGGGVPWMAERRRGRRRRRRGGTGLPASRLASGLQRQEIDEDAYRWVDKTAGAGCYRGRIKLGGAGGARAAWPDGSVGNFCPPSKAI